MFLPSKGKRGGVVTSSPLLLWILIFWSSLSATSPPPPPIRPPPLPTPLHHLSSYSCGQVEKPPILYHRCIWGREGLHPLLCGQITTDIDHYKYMYFWPPLKHNIYPDKHDYVAPTLENCCSVRVLNVGPTLGLHQQLLKTCMKMRKRCLVLFCWL